MSDLAIELPSGHKLVSAAAHLFPGVSNTPLPASLDDGETARMHLAYKDLGETLIEKGYATKTKLVPRCQDSAGKVYRGKAWKVDPKEFARI